MDFALVDRRAADQHGLITTSQALEGGASHGWVRRQVATGRLVPVRRGVLRLAGAPQTQDQAWLAAVLACGDAAVLSHETAAAAWSLKGFDAPDGVDVLVSGTPHRAAGVRGHRTRHLPPFDRSRLRHIPITTPERTLIDASGGLHPLILGRRVDDALRRKLITLPRLVRSFNSVPVSGRRASQAMRRVLAERDPTFDPGGSAAELNVMAILAGPAFGRFLLSSTG